MRKLKLQMQVSVDGFVNFVSHLINQNLIDEYHLFVNPTLMGNGMPVFKNLDSKLSLNLVRSQAFACGIVVHCYRPVR